VAKSLVDRQFVEYKGHRYVIQRHGDVAVADETGRDDDDDDGGDECQRSILVMNVPVELDDAVTCLLESERKGGGEIELKKRENCSGDMLFTFVSKDGQSSSFVKCCIFH